MEDFHARILTQKSSVLVRKNALSEDAGKVICVELHWTFSEFLRIASERLDIFPRAIRAFNIDGAEVDDCMMISETDTLFLSNGESFIPPSAVTSNCSTSSKTESPKEIRGMPSSVGMYNVGIVLGCGGFGEVRLGINKFTGEKVALKFLKKSEIQSMGAAERTSTEIQCLTSLDHRNIIRLHTRLEIHRFVVLVFDFMEGGDMFQYLKRRGPLAADAALPEEDARRIFLQVINGVDYAHKHHIIHKDLKLENLLLKDTTLEIIKIADFGLSQFCRPGVPIKSDGSGTLSTAAPELLSVKGCNAGPPLDIWSLGVVLFALLCGRLPFEGPNLTGDQPTESQIRKNISKCKYFIDDRVSVEGKDLLRKILKFDPIERASLAQILQHPWLKMKKNPPHETAGDFHYVLSSLSHDENSITPFNPVNDGYGNMNDESDGNISHMRNGKDKSIKKLSSILENLSINTEDLAPIEVPPYSFFKSPSSSSNKSKSPSASPLLSCRRTSLSALDDLTDELDKSISDRYLESFSVTNSDSPTQYRRGVDTDVLDSTYSSSNFSDFSYISPYGDNSMLDYCPSNDVKGWGASRSRANGDFKNIIDTKSNSNDNRNPSYEKNTQHKIVNRNRSYDTLPMTNPEKLDDTDRSYARTRFGTEDRLKAAARVPSSSVTSRQSLSQFTSSSSYSAPTTSYTAPSNSMRSMRSPQSVLADEIDRRLHNLEKSKEI